MEEFSEIGTSSTLGEQLKDYAFTSAILEKIHACKVLPEKSKLKLRKIVAQEVGRIDSQRDEVLRQYQNEIDALREKLK
ncbi:hypothetical protein KI387_018271, partial [Taxus chinensis]